jgi:hypothetical protein
MHTRAFGLSATIVLRGAKSMGTAGLDFTDDVAPYSKKKHLTVHIS